VVSNQQLVVAGELMHVTATLARTGRLGWDQAIVALTGLIYMLIGLSLLLVPVWFYETIGHFPPFNRHYLGDLGSFLLPLGIGLLLAAAQPSRYRLLLWVVGCANLLHSLNHVYDAWTGSMSLTHWLIDTVPLLLGALLFSLALRSPKGDL
jgi:hypothetical protein